MSIPTISNTGAVAAAGIAKNRGEKNSPSEKSIATTTAVNPVLPPSSISVADSIYVVVVPASPANTVARASVRSGSSMSERFQFSSRKPALADAPMSMPLISSRSMVNMVRIQQKTPMSAPRKYQGEEKQGKYWVAN